MGMSFELLKELTEAPGIPGREEQIRAIVERELKGIVEAVRVDAMGNLIAFRPGQARKPRKIMYSAHMDEIGFIVRFIDDNGFIRLNPVGGHDPRNCLIQQVQVHGKEVLDGVMTTSTKPVHVQTEDDRKKALAVDDLFIDAGLSAKEIRKIVTPGDMVTLKRETTRIGKRVSGKSMDNRTAVYSLIQSLKKSGANRDDTYAVFTVQEEVGLRGAQTSGYGVAPDIAIALDTTLALDTPGIEARDQITQLGKGVGLTVMDGSVISDHALLKEFEALAGKKKIQFQHNILPRGGTDAGAIQRVREGVKVITISLPTRYIHSSIEMIDWNDLAAKIDLLSAYMKG
ncbi:MAG: M42 family metallopeptidase [Candidatus Omnitrophica bacterium]|nr:M42 family metallopeptidase [bacterium]MCC6733094.1 M42 family metallopeptidase [Candidatus Omnitrophota bacterium]MCE7910033.1 M42 family peptidase [Candidatus Omnitrophica bacterium COP1]